MLAIEPTTRATSATATASVASELAHLCKAAGDPLRLQILRVLRQDSFAVLELCGVFEMRQPAMSHHLKVLANAGAVVSRREGNTIFYRRAPLARLAELNILQLHLFECINHLPLPADLEQRLEQLQLQRQQLSQEFFQQNAHKFRAQQDLIASYEQYADTVAQLLNDAPLQRHQLALEVGPGDGAFLGHLAPRFARVVALDNAPEMLEQARAMAASSGFDNIEFIDGDTGDAARRGIQADCIIVNMVLHHTPSPAEIFSDLAVCLAPDGVLLVTDLCSHDQVWARESCGDVWLGFEPGDLVTWAQQAGLREIASEYLAQRNGFQTQVRLFGHQ
jgi:ubiquinone/menaquinone biosynthesis C-methylase UbiE/DNA-binding transcriptional ArsR family regulator